MQCALVSELLKEFVQCTLLTGSQKPDERRLWNADLPRTRRDQLHLVTHVIGWSTRSEWNGRDRAHAGRCNARVHTAASCVAAVAQCLCAGASRPASRGSYCYQLPRGGVRAYGAATRRVRALLFNVSSCLMAFLITRLFHCCCSISLEFNSKLFDRHLIY